MSNEFKAGQLVFLTRVADVWLADRRTNATALILGGRIAKILEIVDWESEFGKEVLEKRKSGKSSAFWAQVENPLDYKYKVEIYLPEMPRTKETFGLVMEDWLPSHYVVSAGKRLPFFLELDPSIVEKLLSA